METLDYEVIIFGTGPAGLQAAIHAARAKVSVLVLGRAEKSSIYNAEIENYCCLKNISGNDLISQGKEQALDSGAVFLEEDSIHVEKKDEVIEVTTESGKKLNTGAIIFCLGVSRKNLNVSGEKEFKGRGVSYCVDCDANFFKNKPVAIVGNGSGAVSGALTLRSYTDTVYLISKKIEVTEQLHSQLNNSDITVMEGNWVKDIRGSSLIETVVLEDDSSLGVQGLFIELGAKGAIELASFMGVGMDNSLKFIDVNKRQETSIPGVFAAGDICGPPWQIAKAVGEGCVAGLEAAKYAKKLRR